MELILEGSKINTVADFHKKVKNLLELPDYYGENLDALWDCLTGWIETPLIIVWNDFNISRNNLGDFADKVVSLFKDAESQMSGFSMIYR